MDIHYSTEALEKIQTDVVIVPAFEGAAPAIPSVAELYASGDFSGKAQELSLLYRPAGLAAARLLAAGAGKREKFSAIELRRMVGAAIRFLKEKSTPRVALALEPGGAAEQAGAAVEAAILAEYEPDAYKTGERERKAIASFTVVAPGGPPLAAAVETARVVGESQNFARALANEPANRMTPAVMAGRARQMAAEQGLECEVLEQDRMRQLGMGALLGVAQGSAEPPCLIVLRYRPAAGGDGKAHLALVGKGVTFDTGGISIKPSADMDKMKYDMAGGAAVMGAMRALAQLKPAIPVTALVPAVENMPGSRAQRPGDIVTTLSGKTVEVLNTDAEGRLILADALTYAQRLGCTHLVDAATLTGAIVVALGHVNAGAFSNDEQLESRVLAAARGAGEKIWPMPLEEDYKESLKSAFADLPNVGPRWGGAITAAYFLKEFADPAPWVHLDIAGTAWLDEAKPYLAKGPTGTPVATMVRLAMEWGK